MTLNDYYVQKEAEYRTERLARSLRAGDTSRARVAWRRRRNATESVS